MGLEKEGSFQYCSDFAGWWSFLILLKIEEHRICVCVRKRPLNKQGKPHSARKSFWTDRVPLCPGSIP